MSSRSVVLKPYVTSSFIKCAKGIGISDFPVATLDQLIKLAHLGGSAAIISVDVDFNKSLEDTLNDFCSLVQHAVLVGIDITGISLNFQGTEITNQKACFLVHVAEQLCKQMDNKPVNLYFGPEFLMNHCDSNWHKSLHNVMAAAEFNTNVLIHIDASDYLFQDAFYMWARVKAKQQPVTHGSFNLYSVSEGIFTVFGNLLGSINSNPKPSVIVSWGITIQFSFYIKCHFLGMFWSGESLATFS